MGTTVRVEGPRPCEVRIAPGALAQAEELVARHSGALVLTDETVGPLHLARLGRLAEGPVLRVPPGEPSKSLACLERVLDALCEAELDRGACLVALGGGVVGDLGGLAASLFKRGIAVLQCPTTLLAQVDASVGGKTAVNLRAGKNLAGTFHDPVAVLADPLTLTTLPGPELRSGLGEVLKTALLDGEGHLTALEEEADRLVALEPDALEACVARCVRFKASVVAEDPLEAGPRQQLNLGHTFAHAIEHLAGYGAVPHGVAVAAGLGMALEESARRGILADAELPARVAALAARLGLPTGLAELDAAPDRDELLAAMRHDKKNRGGEVRLVLPVRAGEVRLGVPLGA